jgi:hypothetical protein
LAPTIHPDVPNFPQKLRALLDASDTTTLISLRDAINTLFINLIETDHAS